MATAGRPCVVIVGGVNGSGKSTFAKHASATAVLLGQTPINPDELTTEARRDHTTLNEIGANLMGVERAEKAVWRAVAEGHSVAVETVLSSRKFVAVVRAAHRRGYRTRLIFVALPYVELALERIRARVAIGGHDVPAAKVRARWASAHDNLRVFLPLVDDILIFSNVAEPLFVAERVGRRGLLRLRDPAALPEVTRRLMG